MIPAPEEYDAVILAGGAGRRLGGADKAALVVGGMTLLDRVLLASASARRTVVVGEPRATVRSVIWTREEPHGGGPVAALDAGLDRLPGSRTVLVLATDLTRLRPDDVVRLLQALSGDVDAALFSDAEGYDQPLAAVYRAPALRRALAALEPVAGKALRLVVQQLTVRPVPDLGAAGDCDTPDQLAAARARIERS